MSDDIFFMYYIWLGSNKKGEKNPIAPHYENGSMALSKVGDFYNGVYGKFFVFLLDPIEISPMRT